MKKKLSFLLFFAITGTLFFCKSKQMDTKKEEEVKIVFPEKKVSKEIYNEDKTLILLLEYKVTQNPITTFDYRVVNAKTKQEVIKDTFTGVKIEWLTTTSLKCTKYVGMVQKDGVEKSENFTIIEINATNK